MKMGQRREGGIPAPSFGSFSVCTLSYIQDLSEEGELHNVGRAVAEMT